MTTGNNGGSSRFLSAIASRLGIREIDVFRELAEGQSEEDVDLNEFGDEIEGWHSHV